MLTTRLKLLAAATLLTTASYSDADIKSSEVKTLPLEDFVLPYVESGTGEPIIFVHGSIGDLYTWSEYQEPISTKHRFITYSRRFHDEPPSPDAEVNYDHEVHAEDLAKLIKTINAGPVHLVTSSSGAYTASIVAAQHPELVKTMIQFEPITTSKMMKDVPHYEIYGEEWDSQWGVVVEQVDAGDLRHAMRKFVEIVFELPAGGFDGLPKVNQDRFLSKSYIIPILFSGETTLKTDCDYVSNIKIPTLVVLGTRTHRAFAMEVERMAECLPNGSLQLISGANHAGTITDRETFVELIDNFVAKHN